MNEEAHTDIMGFRAFLLLWPRSGLERDHLRMQRGVDPDDDEASLSIRTDAYDVAKPSSRSGRIFCFMASPLEEPQ